MQNESVQTVTKKASIDDKIAKQYLTRNQFIYTGAAIYSCIEIAFSLEQVQSQGSSNITDKEKYQTILKFIACAYFVASALILFLKQESLEKQRQEIKIQILLFFFISIMNLIYIELFFSFEWQQSLTVFAFLVLFNHKTIGLFFHNNIKILIQIMIGTYVFIRFSSFTGWDTKAILQIFIVIATCMLSSTDVSVIVRASAAAQQVIEELDQLAAMDNAQQSRIAILSDNNYPEQKPKVTGAQTVTNAEQFREQQSAKQQLEDQGKHAIICFNSDENKNTNFKFTQQQEDKTEGKQRLISGERHEEVDASQFVLPTNNRPLDTNKKSHSLQQQSELKYQTEQDLTISYQQKISPFAQEKEQSWNSQNKYQDDNSIYMRMRGNTYNQSTKSSQKVGTELRIFLQSALLNNCSQGLLLISEKKEVVIQNLRAHSILRFLDIENILEFLFLPSIVVTESQPGKEQAHISTTNSLKMQKQEQLIMKTSPPTVQKSDEWAGDAKEVLPDQAEKKPVEQQFYLNSLLETKNNSSKAQLAPTDSVIEDSIVVRAQSVHVGQNNALIKMTFEDFYRLNQIHNSEIRKNNSKTMFLRNNQNKPVQNTRNQISKTVNHLRTDNHIQQPQKGEDSTGVKNKEYLSELTYSCTSQDGSQVAQITIRYREILQEGFVLVLLDEGVGKSDQEQRWEEVITTFKRGLIQSLSHELRTPLNCTQNMLVQLRERLEEEFQQPNVDLQQLKQYTSNLREQLLDPALCACELMLNTMCDLQDYYALDQGSFRMVFCNFNLEELIKHCLYLYQQQSIERHIEILYAYDPEIPELLHNDPERVKQALLNLLSNALKYTQSGSIRIEATLVEKDQIAVAVCDTGIGITKQDKEAFEQYVAGLSMRYDNNNAANSNQAIKKHMPLSGAKERGIGLGHSVTCNIARGLSPVWGQIQVESEVGVGSKFTFFVQNFVQEARGVKIRKYSLFNQEWQRCHTYYSNSESVISHSRSREIKEYPANTPPMNYKQLKQYRLQAQTQYDGSDLHRTTENNSPLTLPSATRNLRQGANQSFFSNQISPMRVGKTHSQRLIEQQQQNSSVEKLGVLEENHEEECLSFRELVCENVDENENQQSNTISRSPAHLNIEVARRIVKRCVCPQILCVDDDPFNLKVIVSTLQRLKFLCEQVNNGQEAVDLVQLRAKNNACCPSFQLIFMDIDMPLISGFEAAAEISAIFTKRIRKTKDQPQQKLIKPSICAHSAFLDRDAELRARKCGMDFMLPKPLNAKRLDEVLIRHFPMYKMDN